LKSTLKTAIYTVKFKSTLKNGDLRCKIEMFFMNFVKMHKQTPKTQFDYEE